LQESPLLLSMVEGRPELVQAKDVFEAVRKGDGMCTDIVSQAAQALAAGIANLFAILNPEAIIIGGGIAQSADILFPLLRRFIAERGSVCKHVADLIVPAQLGQDAGCIGAGLLAQRSMEVCCGN
jgi:glucokinase